MESRFDAYAKSAASLISPAFSKDLLRLSIPSSAESVWMIHRIFFFLWFSMGGVLVLLQEDLLVVGTNIDKATVGRRKDQTILCS